MQNSPSPAKSQMPLIAFFSNFRINGIRLFDSPSDAEGFPRCDSSLCPDRVVKPPATPSFMDYFLGGLPVLVRKGECRLSLSAEGTFHTSPARMSGYDRNKQFRSTESAFHKEDAK